jgi:MFS family permease
MFVMALGMGLLAAAKIEQFTQTICSQINEDTMLAHPELDQDRLLPILLLTPEQCRHSTEVQKKVAQLNLCINVIMGLSCIVTTPFWGSLSDRIGRKLCIVLNTMSFVLGDLILIVVLAFPQKVSYWWILLYPLLEGIFGGMGGGQSIMAAYVRRGFHYDKLFSSHLY